MQLQFTTELTSVRFSSTIIDVARESGQDGCKKKGAAYLVSDGSRSEVVRLCPKHLSSLLGEGFALTRLP